MVYMFQIHILIIVISVKNKAFIITSGNVKIGFYNVKLLNNGIYEVGNICIIPKYQGEGLGTNFKNINDKCILDKSRRSFRNI